MSGRPALAPRGRRGGCRFTPTLLTRLLLCLVGAGLVLLVSVAPASAHDVLSGSTPADGQTVARTPASVVLSFEEPAVAMGTQVVVTGPSGPVQQGAPRLVDTTVTQDLGPGSPAGHYTVEWRVTSADGHPVSGTFSFTSTGAGTGDPTSRATPQPTASSTPASSGATDSAAGTGSNRFPGWLWIVAGIALIATAGAAGRRFGQQRPPQRP